MNQALKIEIPNPCFEDWDKMTPQKDGKHCQSCNKIVVEFTKMTDEEIKHYFINNQSTKTCGNFYKDQITSHKNGLKKTLVDAYTNAQHINLKLFRYASLCVLSIVIFLIGCTERTQGKVENSKPEKLTGDSIAAPIIDSTKIKKDTLKKQPTEKLTGILKYVEPKRTTGEIIRVIPIDSMNIKNDTSNVINK